MKTKERRNIKGLGVTNRPPSRTLYGHKLRIFHLYALCMLLNVFEPCCYQPCVTLIETAWIVVALTVNVTSDTMLEVFMKLAEISPTFCAPRNIGMAMFNFLGLLKFQRAFLVSCQRGKRWQLRQ